MTLTKDAQIRIRRRSSSDDWTEALVAVASSGPGVEQSVMVLLDGAVRAAHGIVAGCLPITVNYETEAVTGIDGQEYEVEVSE